jgi:hypothetical protein
MQKKIFGSRGEICKTYYELLQVIARGAVKSKTSPITDKEVAILSMVVELNNDGIFTKGVRGKIQRSLGLSAAALSNHLGRMKEKNLLIEDGDLRVNPKFIPSSKEVVNLSLNIV